MTPTKPSKSQVVASRTGAKAIERVTGQWFCQSGAHYTKAEQVKRKGRPICKPCNERLQALTRKGTPS